MEAEVERFASERQTLLGDWQQTRDALARVSDPLQRDSLRADLLLLGAKLNHGDLQQVRTYLTTIAGLIPKLKQLKDELGLGGMGTSPAVRQATQRQLGNLMTNAATLLSGLQISLPEAKQEVRQVEHTLVGLLRQWEAPAGGSAQDIAELDLSIRELHDAYAQFTSVRQLLVQERLALKAENYKALAHLAVKRLGQSRLDTQGIAAAASSLRSGIRSRMNTLRVEPLQAPALLRDVPATPSDRAALSRMRRGDYQWQRR